MFSSISNLFSQPPGSPYFGEDIHLIVNGVVKNVEGVRQENVDNAPTQSGVSLTVWVYYTHYAAGSEAVWISEYKTQTVVSSLGKYEVVFNLGDEVLTINDVGVEINNRSDWLIKYKSINKLYDTYYTGNLYVIPMIDDDKNGIRDDFEWELVKKFCPSLIAHRYLKEILPEPVEIMGGDYNSKICVTWTHGEEKITHFIGFPADKFEIETGINTNIFIPVIENFNDKFNREFDCSFMNQGSIELQENQRIREKIGPYQYQNWASFKSNSHVWIHFDWKGSNTNHWWLNYNQERQQNNFSHTVYCTIWEETISSYPFNNYQVVVQYWFLYPYDDWANDHEGDWEHINVIISSQFSEWAELERVQFYFHLKWKEWNYSTEKTALEVEDNTHVKVYIGGEAVAPLYAKIFGFSYDGENSNASYPYKGKWTNVGEYLYDDYAAGEGSKVSWKEIVDNSRFYLYGNDDLYYDIGRGLILLKDADYWENTGFFKKHTKYSWLKSDIFFGEPAQDPITNAFKGYKGPWRKTDWRKLGGFGTYQLY